MDKIDFKFYNLNVTQQSKLSWEKNEIKNPRFSLKGLETKELTLDEAEEIIINSIKSSFSDLREVISMNEFKEAKVIMPSFQMCSIDGFDVIDFGIKIIDIDKEDQEIIDDETSSDWNHPSEMWEEFAEMMIENEEDEGQSDIEEENKENELDIIKKIINNDK